MSTKNIVICCNLQWNYFHTSGSSYLGEPSKVVLKRILSYLNSINTDQYSVMYTRDIRSPEDNFWMAPAGLRGSLPLLFFRVSRMSHGQKTREKDIRFFQKLSSLNYKYLQTKEISKYLRVDRFLKVVIIANQHSNNKSANFIF